MKKGIVILSVMILGIILTGCAGNPAEKGVEYLENGQYKEALEQFEEAVDQDVNAADAYRGIGMAKWEQEDYEGAREAFLSALDGGTEKTGTIYNFLGNCEMKLGNPTGALSYYRLALTAKDSSAELEQQVKFNTIAAYEEMKDWESARAKLKEYLAEYPDDERAQKEAEFLETR